MKVYTCKEWAEQRGVMCIVSSECMVFVSSHRRKKIWRKCCQRLFSFSSPFLATLCHSLCEFSCYLFRSRDFQQLVTWGIHSVMWPLSICHVTFISWSCDLWLEFHQILRSIWHPLLLSASLQRNLTFCFSQLGHASLWFYLFSTV